MNKPTNWVAPKGTIRLDLQLVADMVEGGSRVLDVGAGDGALLAYLVHYKQADGRGIEIARDGVTACVSQGLAVIQGDAEEDLKDYPADCFDYVILSQTLHAMHDVRGALAQLLRIGRHAIVSFHNYGHWRMRGYLLFRGRVPLIHARDWSDTPNIHPCSINDFLTLTQQLGIKIERAVTLNERGRQIGGLGPSVNLRAEQAVFLLSRA
jgi:methionine biosynthesis protein MetW